MATKTKRRRKATEEGISVRGFFRIRITEGDRVVGDSGVDEHGNLVNGDGLRANQVCATGIKEYLCLTLAGSAGSKTISHIALGSGGAPATGDTALAGELTQTASARQTFGALSTAASGAGFNVSFFGTFNSTTPFVTSTSGFNASNIGLFNTSAVTVGTIFAGNTFASSNILSNNNVNVTYGIKFATA